MDRRETRVGTHQSNNSRAGGGNGGCAELDDCVRLGYAVPQSPTRSFAYPLTYSIAHPLSYSIAYGVADKATGLTHDHHLANQR